MVAKRIVQINRGDIYVVNFDPTIGSEIQKTRPALILQNDIANKYSSVTIVAAITSHDENEKLYPTEVLIKKGTAGLTNNSAVLLNQVRTIDRQRLVKKIGSVDTKTMKKVTQALQISLGLIDI